MCEYERDLSNSNSNQIFVHFISIRILNEPIYINTLTDCYLFIIKDQITSYLNIYDMLFSVQSKDSGRRFEYFKF